MPTYLMHGFRWSRPLIRIHIILQNLDDAAAEWVVGKNPSNDAVDQSMPYRLLEPRTD